jgi:hypothetical protein
MGKSIYIGVSNVAQKIKKAYIGVNGVACKVKKVYIGVDGVARLAWNYGLERYVAVGRNGVTYYSLDGISWTAMTGISSVKDINAVTYGNGRFVCVGNSGTSYYSTDGTTWTAMTGIYNTAFYGVAYGNNRFVAVGFGAIYYSTDGTTWIAIAIASPYPSTYKTHYYGITYGNGRFVFCGFTLNESSTAIVRQFIDYMLDDTTRIVEPYSSTTNLQALYAVTYGNGRFVCVGSNGWNYYSTDNTASSWTAFPLTGTTTSACYNITYGKDKFVTIISYGANYIGKPYYSSDGITWSNANAITSESIEGICYAVDGGYGDEE